MKIVKKARHPLSPLQLCILGINIYLYIHICTFCFVLFILAVRSCPFKNRKGNLAIEFVCKGLVLADGRLL